MFAYALRHTNEQYEMHKSLFFFKTEKKGHSVVQSLNISVNYKLCCFFFIVFDFYGIVCIISTMVAECSTKHRFTKCLILPVTDLFPKSILKHISLNDLQYICLRPSVKDTESLCALQALSVTCGIHFPL